LATPLSTGFSLGTSSEAQEINNTSEPFVSWTFRKQPKFFDVVTYTGNGSNRTIAHNLGSVPGCIIVKRTDTSADWQVYHRSNANTEYMVLNSTAAKATGTTRWNSTTPTSTEFSLGTDTTVNASGGTYVAYLFAHDAGGFGASGTDNVISCGSVSLGTRVELGWEPQFILGKHSAASGQDWFIVDNMRGLPTPASGNTPYSSVLNPNLSAAESTNGLTEGAAIIDATGFKLNPDTTVAGAHIYIAIRRGPMRTPTTGTSVFSPVARAGTGANTTTSTGFPVDAAFTGNRTDATIKFGTVDRLRNNFWFATCQSDSEIVATATRYQSNVFDVQSGIKLGDGSPLTNVVGNDFIDFNFRRAPGFFDVVCYTGNGVNGTTQNHNLGKLPELIIVKCRSSGSTAWAVGFNFSVSSFEYATLNGSGSAFSNSYTSGAYFGGQPTSTTFTLATNASTNQNNDTYVAYLFASVAGVSKVGSYTGNGSSQTINCGFTGGARFVLIKATSTTGDWLVADSARGIVAGNDPYLELNTTNAEVTGDDWLDTDSTGFVVNEVSGSNANTNGVSYIFLAVA
jgi:hypothetical protein